MFKLIFFVCCLLLSSFHQVDLRTSYLRMYAGEDCTPEGQPGICTVLEECDEVVQMLKNTSVHAKDKSEKLRSLTCGFHFKEPLVCCTSSKDTGTPYYADGDDDRYIWGNVDTFNKTSDESNFIGRPEDKRGNSDVLPDVTNHPNLKLLPDICGNIQGDRILGGTRTLLFEMPWMVLISYFTGRKTEQNCGGTLITENYVLTAAHCVSFLRGGTTLNGVILGEYDISQDPDCAISDNKKYCAPEAINATIDRVIPHPGYSPKTMFDDIALIRLAEPVDLNSASISPICLPITPELQRESFVGNNVTVAGWGITEDRIQSSVLLSVFLPVHNNDVCQKAYIRTLRINDKQICAGGMEDVDSCNGDSGGPLMLPGNLGNEGVRYIQRGIVSFGSIRCGVKDLPTVYTNVAYYMDWILNNISD